MNRHLRLGLLVAGPVVLAAAAILLAAWLRTDTTLELTVRDAVSGRWVWDMAMHIQGRAVVGYYQSDTGPKPYRFTHLSPGTSTLQIAAAGYQAVNLPVTLRRGRNQLPAPIDMVGLGIPELAKFFIFEQLDAGDIVAELRPVSTAGEALTNHPCMDLWVGCLVSVQVKNGVPVEEPVETGSARGAPLFRGEIAWTWDPAPETQFRYRARIPSARVQPDSSLYRVVDYLIVEPNPLLITRTQLGQLMERVFSMEDPARIAAALEAEKDRLRYFIDTSWNVKAREQ
jgi:hypothetical protein